MAKKPRKLVSSTSGGVTTTLTYDPLGRLYEVSSPSGVRRFLYAVGENGLPEAIGEYDGANVGRHFFAFGPGTDEPMLWWDLTGTAALRTLHPDERGSIIAVGDGSGNPFAINRYDEHGSPQGGSVTGHFGFTGQLWLPEVGLYYYKARMYSPALGRFMQPDPIGPADDANLYQYALNNPVNNTDPLGLSCEGNSTVGTDGEDCSEIVVAKKLNKPDPSGGNGGSESEIVITATRAAADIVVTGSYTVDLTRYVGDLSRYTTQSIPSYVNGVARAVVKLQKPPKPPKPPKRPPTPTAHTVDRKAQDIQNWYASQRGTYDNWKGKTIGVVNAVADFLGALFE